METQSAPAPTEWSPSAESAEKKEVRKPRRNQSFVSRKPAEDEYPTSFSANPTEPAVRAAEPEVSSAPAAEPVPSAASGEPARNAQEGNSDFNRRENRQNFWRDRNNRNNRNGKFNNHNNRNDRNDRNNFNRQNQQNNQPRNNNNNRGPNNNPQRANDAAIARSILDTLPNWEILGDIQQMEATARSIVAGTESISYDELLGLGGQELLDRARAMGIAWEGAPVRDTLLTKILAAAFEKKIAILAEGVVDRLGDEAILVFGCENYRIRPASPYLPKALITRYGLERGTQIKVQLHPAREDSKLPIALMVLSVSGEAPEKNLSITPFEELTPYYPTKRILLEATPDVKWDNFSMRVVDLLTPIGFGQRGLIVAPPRTGKTILMQGIANAIAQNHPEAHLIVLLIDERPEEVTDFKRMIKGEVVSSTFDQTPLSHTHAAEIVIEKARRMVERGEHVVILLDSITRLARAYNAMTGNSGKIMSGGVESNALQKPKRFFGSARNIEGGGSLTIIGTALIETGSKMDEVIFEEFKGTGNMELNLDRALSDKRLFPAIAMDRSGTRKEELLYHSDELQKVYGLRRAMKGVTPIEAMEMLLARMKKTRTNIEFLMGLAK
jgi:transcription termination factor Rho